MDDATFAKAMGGMAFLDDLSLGAIDKLARLATMRHVRGGEVLFREGDQNDAFYLVKSGRIALEMCVPARGCMHLLTLGEGEIVAWSALVGGGRMTSMAMAQIDSELIEIQGRALLKVCESDHELGYQLMRRLATALSRRLVATRLQLLDLFAQEDPAQGGGRG